MDSDFISDRHPKNCLWKSQLSHLWFSHPWDSNILNSCISIIQAERATIRKFCQVTHPKGSVLISSCEQRGKYFNVGNFQFYKYMQISLGDDDSYSLKILN